MQDPVRGRQHGQGVGDRLLTDYPASEVLGIEDAAVPREADSGRTGAREPGRSPATTHTPTERENDRDGDRRGEDGDPHVAQLATLQELGRAFPHARSYRSASARRWKRAGHSIASPFFPNHDLGGGHRRPSDASTLAPAGSGRICWSLTPAQDLRGQLHEPSWRTRRAPYLLQHAENPAWTGTHGRGGARARAAARTSRCSPRIGYSSLPTGAT